MPSIVWNRDPHEASRNPYEYGAQEQFFREANKVLSAFHAELDKLNLTFTAADTSTRKAIWMLQYDALDALRDCLDSLITMKHKLAGRLFRDAWESLELATYFASGSDESKIDLAKWFKRDIIQHSRVRAQIKRSGRTHIAKERAEYYQLLSQFTHRAYGALIRGYSLGRDNLMVYDSHSASGLLVLPHTISEYCAVLASLILRLAQDLVSGGLVNSDREQSIWRECLDDHTVPRRFFQYP